LFQYVSSDVFYIAAVVSNGVCINNQIDILAVSNGFHSSLDTSNQFATFFVGTTSAILLKSLRFLSKSLALSHHVFFQLSAIAARFHGLQLFHFSLQIRSEERRVGKEYRGRW